MTTELYCSSFMKPFSGENPLPKAWQQGIRVSSAGRDLHIESRFSYLLTLSLRQTVEADAQCECAFDLQAGLVPKAGRMPAAQLEPHPTVSSSTSQALRSDSSMDLVQAAFSAACSPAGAMRSTSSPPCGLCSCRSATAATALRLSSTHHAQMHIYTYGSCACFQPTLP